MIGLHKFRLSVSFEIFCGKVIHNLTELLHMYLIGIAIQRCEDHVLAECFE